MYFTNAHCNRPVHANPYTAVASHRTTQLAQLQAASLRGTQKLNSST